MFKINPPLPQSNFHSNSPILFKFLTNIILLHIHPSKYRRSDLQKERIALICCGFKIKKRATIHGVSYREEPIKDAIADVGVSSDGCPNFLANGEEVVVDIVAVVVEGL